MSYTDLHIHSCYSDGKLSPQGILEYAKKNGINTISITDHNTLDAYNQGAVQTGVKLITGVEIDVDYKKNIQLLGYGFNPCDFDLAQSLNKIQIKRMHAKIKLVRSLIKMKIIEKNEVDIFCRMNDFDHICRFLSRKLEGMTATDVKNNYFSEGKILHQDIPSMDLEKCVSMIHNAGGIVILAHPGRAGLNNSQMNSFLDDVMAIGLDGIEVFHPEHDEQLIKTLKAFCIKKGCYQTGGSDMHGSETEYRIFSENLFFNETNLDKMTVIKEYI